MARSSCCTSLRGISAVRPCASSHASEKRGLGPSTASRTRAAEGVQRCEATQPVHSKALPSQTAKNLTSVSLRSSSRVVSLPGAEAQPSPSLARTHWPYVFDLVLRFLAQRSTPSPSSDRRTASLYSPSRVPRGNQAPVSGHQSIVRRLRSSSASILADASGSAARRFASTASSKAAEAKTASTFHASAQSFARPAASGSTSGEKGRSASSSLPRNDSGGGGGASAADSGVFLAGSGSGSGSGSSSSTMPFFLSMRASMARRAFSAFRAFSRASSASRSFFSSRLRARSASFSARASASSSVIAGAASVGAERPAKKSLSLPFLPPFFLPMALFCEACGRASSALPLAAAVYGLVACRERLKAASLAPHGRKRRVSRS
mmetsp:Transcript_17784/g.52889  ORF Transcript_17784/g.52889 Transcript_17784/m.52889 type:complete len:378 (+) Transcript_17784:125-1258(+)